MKNKIILIKLAVFFLGIFVMSLGVALSVKADIGVSPISCIPYIFSMRLPLTLGTLTTLFNIILIMLQIVILRRNYPLVQLLQLPVIFIFGVFIDFALYLVSGLHMGSYFQRLFWCLISCLVIGIGVFLEVKSKITYLPGEGLAIALVDTFHLDFGKTKMGVDSSMVVIGLLFSLLFFYQVRGIREGTVIAAILVGCVAKILTDRVLILDKLTGLKAVKCA